MAKINAMLNVFKGEQSFLLLSHSMPDGDAIGSALALGLALEKMGKTVYLVNPDPIPRLYAFLPGADRFSTQIPEQARQAIPVLLDCAVPERLGDMAALIKDVPVVLNIDHHVSNTQFGTLNYVDATAAATGEMVFQIIKQLQVVIDRAIAAALFTAIATDTGSFRYANTSVQTHRIIAELLTTGIENHRIMTRLFETRSLAETKLLAQALNTLEVTADGKIAWMTVTREMLTMMQEGNDSTEGIINYARAIEGVEVGILFRDLGDGRVKVSLRSQDQVNVDEIAAQFGGGGHAKAAGCILTGDIAAAQQQLLRVIAAKIGGIN